MKLKRIFPTRAMRLVNSPWREVLENFRLMKSASIKLILSITDGLSKEWCIAVHLFWKSCMPLARKSGWLHLALYLKQSRVVLSRFATGDKIPELSVYVSLTRCGLPRIIPSFHRKRIRDGDLQIIPLYLSLFSVSKLIALAPKVQNTLFKSIVEPSDLDSIVRVASEMRPLLKALLNRYVPGIDSIPLKQGLRFVPTWKTVPSGPWYKKLLRGCRETAHNKVLCNRTSIFHCLPYELCAFQFLMTMVHSREEQFSQGCLWPSYTRYAFDSLNKRITPLCLDWFEGRIGPYLPSCEALGVPPNTGRLCCSCTGDGKRRLFAIGNYINQRLLAPVHDWLMRVLKRIPMDGTFNQVSPLDRLKGVEGTVHSVDLKSATDRWPLLLLFELIQSLFDRSFASSVVNSTLAYNIFDVAFTQKRKSVSFIAGQPLGYLSSWPLFALSHHMLIWFAAEQAYPGKIFRRYAVLGDDYVIADDNVKGIYSSLLARIGVNISESKSLTSPSGGCEFAKKLRLNKMTHDVSPISIKKVLETRNPMGWYNFIQTLSRPLRVATQLRLAGFGFKSRSRPLKSNKHGVRASRYIAMYVHSRMSKTVSLKLALSIVIGNLISPYVYGRLISILLEHYVPKDPILPPDEVFAYPGMREFNEYTLYRGWMEMYLSYLRWNCLLRLDPDVSVDSFLDVPVYIRTWYRPAADLDLFRFGIIFQLYDLVRALSSERILALEDSVQRERVHMAPDIIYL